jgi:probable addiction module antidote protein
MTRKTRPYRELLLERLANPEVASYYLNAAIEDSPEAFLKALKNVAQAHQISKVAKDAGIQRETLYRSFSEQGNPTFETLSSVLGALGMRLIVAANGKSVGDRGESARLKVHGSRAS